MTAVTWVQVVVESIVIVVAVAGNLYWSPRRIKEMLRRGKTNSE